jgi:hypothetical protein
LSGRIESLGDSGWDIVHLGYNKECEECAYHEENTLPANSRWSGPPYKGRIEYKDPSDHPDNHVRLVSNFIVLNISASSFSLSLSVMSLQFFFFSK